MIKIKFFPVSRNRGIISINIGAALLPITMINTEQNIKKDL
jgi:hypothetical protein